MDYFLKDIKKFYFFRKKNFLEDKEQVLDKLIINNILFLENFELYRFINDLKLVESLCGFKFNRLKINYKNIYTKNRYLYLIVLIKYKISFLYLCSFLEYIIFYEIIINFFLNNFDKFKILNIFKNYHIKDNFLFINCKFHYTYLSFNNKKRYKKIYFYNSDYFDNKLWLYLYIFFKKIYYLKIFYNLIEKIKIRWLNEKT